MLKLPQHKLIQDCVTRWGSTLGMLERLMEQQAAIAAVLMEGKVRHLMPEGDEWTVIELLVDILKPFHRATEAMGAAKYPTLSTVKPLLHVLLEQTLKVASSDTAVAKEVKEAIRRDLQARYQTAAMQKLMNVATYLDPRYKELPFLSYTSKRTVIDRVEDESLSMESLEPAKPPELEVAQEEVKSHWLKRLRKAQYLSFLDICLSSGACRPHSQTRLRKS